jgi:hypothetical protein
VRYRVRSEACVALRPTHSLPPGRQWNIRHCTAATRVLEAGDAPLGALATNMGHVIAV